MANRFGAGGKSGYPAISAWAFFEYHRIQGTAHKHALLGNRPLDKNDARTIRRWRKATRARKSVVHSLLSKYGFSVEYFTRHCESRDLKLS